MTPLTPPQKSLWTQSLTRIAGPAILLLLTVLFYWKLVLTNQYTWLEGGDIASQVLPWFQFQAGEWHAHRFPMWDPYAWFGQPLFGQGQPGQAYPLNWLLFLVPLKNGWMRQGALHWYFVLIRYLGALNAYLLCRSLGRSRRASILGGCVYGLGGYLANTDWPQMTNGAAWTPLVFLFLFRAERGEKPWSSALLSGFFLGLGWLAGHHQMNLLVTLAAAGIWAWVILRQKRIDWRMLKLAAASMAILAMVSAFQTLPMWEYGQRAMRWTGSPNDPIGFDQKIPYSVHEVFAMKPEGLLGVFIPGVDEGFNPYIGATAAALAFLGLALARKERQARWLGCVALGGILYALGGSSLLHGVMYALAPLVEKSRVPLAGTILVAIGLAPLCAYAVDLVPEEAGSRWVKRVGWTLAGLALLIAGVAIVAYLLKLQGLENRILLSAVTAAVTAGVLAGWRARLISPLFGAVVTTAVVLFELSNVSTFYFPNRAVPDQNPHLHHMSEDGDLANIIRARGVGARAELGEDIGYSYGEWYGIETLNGMGASVLENVWNMDLFGKRGHDFFGVRYYIGKKSRFDTDEEIFKGKSGLKLFENAAAYPRAWIVHEALSIPDIKELRQKFTSRTFDPRTTALVTGKPPWVASCSSDDELADMPVHQPNYVRLNVRTACQGIVVVSDAWFPGWIATVDGKRERILEVDGGVRGIVVGPGSHDVVLRYRPWTVYLGGSLALFGALLTGIVTWQAYGGPRKLVEGVGS